VITQYSNAVIHIINYSSYTELLFTAQYFKYCYSSQFDTPAYNFTILCTTAGKKNPQWHACDKNQVPHAAKKEYTHQRGRNNASTRLKKESRHQRDIYTQDQDDRNS
jgi:hypothetical protein